MAVMDPLKVIIDNYPEGKTEMLEIENNPENEALGKRQVQFSREIYIDREDFMEVPVKKFFRLAPTKEVRLKGAYFVTCVGIDKDGDGNITAVHCTYDPDSRGGESPDGRKVKGTIHWVDAKTAVEAEARLYDYLMIEDAENSGEMVMNPDSLKTVKCLIEPSIVEAKAGDKYQFMRNGYYCVDTKDSKENALVFNRIVSLKSSFKIK